MFRFIPAALAVPAVRPGLTRQGAGNRARTLIVATTLAGLTAGLVTTPVAAAPDPITCTGYPEPRMFIEAQDWWMPIPGVGGQGHVHMGMCWPVNQTVRGRVRFDMRIVFHDNKGRLDLIKLQDDTSRTLHRLFPNHTPPATPNSEYWQTFNVDTRRMPDGRRLFRWYARVRHINGNVEYARAAWSLQVENGKLNRNAVPWGYYQGSGWYKEHRLGIDWGYQTAVIKSGIPTRAVRGIWRPRVSLGCNGCRPMSFWFATVDPDFHNGSQGWIVRRGRGSFSDPLAIDTRRLSNGAHRLVLVSASSRYRPSLRRHNGVLAIPFRVSN
jgi:hypothetical protein